MGILSGTHNFLYQNVYKISVNVIVYCMLWMEIFNGNKASTVFNSCNKFFVFESYTLRLCISS
jgi:hypothetical protein